MPKFSEKLIARTQTYFSQKYGRFVSAEEANEILDSMADLYEIMAKAASASLKAAEPPASKPTKL